MKLVTRATLAQGGLDSPLQSSQPPPERPGLKTPSIVIPASMLLGWYRAILHNHASSSEGSLFAFTLHFAARCWKIL